MDLRGNALSGALPSELADLTSLTTLQLERSRALTGSLPDGLRNLADLATVQIAETELCAPGDDTFQAWWRTISKTGLICPPQRVTLVAVGEVDYTEVSGVTDLNRLASRLDGHMDEVHAIRDRAGADIVILIRRQTDAGVGGGGGGGGALPVMSGAAPPARRRASSGRGEPGVRKGT